MDVQDIAMHERDRVLEIDPEMLFLEPAEFDSAIIGVADRIGMETVVAYDKDAIMLILMRDMTEEDALEYFDYNIVGAYVGDKTPVFITRI